MLTSDSVRAVVDDSQNQVTAVSECNIEHTTMFSESLTVSCLLERNKTPQFNDFKLSRTQRYIFPGW
jgi:hypothetical protein